MLSRMPWMRISRTAWKAKAVALGGCLCLAAGCRFSETGDSESGSVGAAPASSHAVAHAQSGRGSTPFRTLRPGILRIGTWNLEHLRAEPGQGPAPRGPRDFQRMAAYADSLEADVLAVQEVGDEAALARVFSAESHAFELSRTGASLRNGFVLRRGLHYRRLPDAEALALEGRLRAGVDIELLTPAGGLRILGVHLKSGCFDDAAPKNRHCRVAGSQRGPLEAWTDARAREGIPFLVLGDFNRRFRSGDSFWDEWDDADPPGLDLILLGEGRRSGCRDGRYPEFIDHVVADARAAVAALPGSWRQWNYLPGDWRRYRLSDHCALTLDLRIDGQAPAAAAPAAVPLPVPQGRSQETGLRIQAVLPDPKGDDASREALRLFNAGRAPIALSGWRLYDRGGAVWVLDAAGVLEPGGIRVLRRDGQALSLNNRGDALALVDPFGDTAQTLSYGPVREGEWVTFPGDLVP